MSDMKETLIPQVVTVTDIRVETPDVKTFRIVTPEGKKPFEHIPGQCAMLSVPGVGEAMISITSSPISGTSIRNSSISISGLERVTNSCAPRASGRTE